MYQNFPDVITCGNMMYHVKLSRNDHAHGFATGGVCHEIRPIRMRYLINSFHEREQHSGEVKEVCDIFSRSKFVRKLEE